VTKVGQRDDKKGGQYLPRWRVDAVHRLVCCVYLASFSCGDAGLGSGFEIPVHVCVVFSMLRKPGG
jgi:hypothetical protein